MGVFYAPDSDSFHIVAHLNLPEDRSILLYHSETGQVERLEGSRQVMLILPGGQRMPLVPWQDTPTYDDGFDLVWVDAPEQPPARLQVSGHTPRNYPDLQSRLLPSGARLLPDGARMLFGSTQGISLVSLPSGETLAFWQLVDAENTILPALSLAPHGRALIAIANVTPMGDAKDQGSLLYWLALEE